MRTIKFIGYFLIGFGSFHCFAEGLRGAMIISIGLAYLLIGQLYDRNYRIK